MVTYRLSFITGLITNDWLSCNFESNHSCEWIDDANNWLANWRPTSYASKGDYSVKEKHQLVLCTQFNSRTKSRLRNHHGQFPGSQKINSVVRIISPPITSLDSVKCLSFMYRFENSPHFSSSSSSALNLLRRSEGIFGVLCIRLSFLAIDPVYFCPFTKNLCDWTNDPNSWQNHWSVIEEPNWHTTDNNGVSPTTSEESYCCLTSAVYSGSDSSNMAVRHSPWIIQPHLLNDLKDSTTKKAIHSRLWSASIPTKLGLKCMTFVYSIQFGSSSYHQDSNLFSDSTKEASLAVLQRSEGNHITLLYVLCFIADFQVKPMHICTLDGSLCGWMNDMNTWKHQWKLVTNKQSISSNEQLSTSMLCMNANEATPDDWFNSFSPSDLRSLSNPKMNKPVQTRLWSPPIQAKHKLHCLTFMYHVDIGVKQALLNNQRDEKPSLAMLRRQEG
uniref:MAM domain-containing protein n=1 Tax=Schistosoma haematobium TaxID=6185 RepID=A0A095B0F9_SCHHA